MIEPADLRRQVALGEVALSPDGRLVAYTRRTTRGDRDRCAIWLVPYARRPAAAADGGRRRRPLAAVRARRHGGGVPVRPRRRPPAVRDPGRRRRGGPGHVAAAAGWRSTTGTRMDGASWSWPRTSTPTRSSATGADGEPTARADPPPRLAARRRRADAAAAPPARRPSRRRPLRVGSRPARGRPGRRGSRRTAPRSRSSPTSPTTPTAASATASTSCRSAAASRGGCPSPPAMSPRSPTSRTAALLCRARERFPHDDDELARLYRLGPGGALDGSSLGSTTSSAAPPTRTCSTGRRPTAG